jgi:peptidoglycan/xylan/chitin deacetylase (PgdA/CDA1 family)
MSKRATKACVAGALSAVAGDRLIGRLTGATRVPLVVGYHRVVDDVRSVETPTISQMLVSLPMFERHLDWIGRRYEFVTLDELAVRLEAGYEHKRPMAAITFDDGYADVYEQAFPMLMRKGIPAAIFVVTDWIGTSKLLIHDRVYRLLAEGWPQVVQVLIRHGVSGLVSRTPGSPFNVLRQLLTSRRQEDLARLIPAIENELDARVDAPASLRPLGWGMIATMRRAGITIGSHTRRHAVLTCERLADVHAEANESRMALRRHLGEEVRYFAYPDGAYDMNVLEAVAKAGYRLALTACHHRSDAYRLLTIPRRLFWENTSLDSTSQFSPAVLSCLTNGVFDLVAGCRRPHGDAAAA